MDRLVDTLPLWLFLVGAVLFVIGTAINLARAYS